MTRSPIQGADASKGAAVDVLDRFRGTLFGGAVGDALGYPVEFMTGRQLSAEMPAPPVRLPLGAGGTAIVSDDTQMTLFTAEGWIRARMRFADPGICNPTIVFERAYLRWLDTQGECTSYRDRHGLGSTFAPDSRGWLIDVPELRVRRAPGNTCLSALRSLAGGGVCPSVEAPPNNSKGCGAIMRSAPIGLATYTREAAFTMARAAGALTHGHPSGYLSGAYFAAVIWDLVRDVSLLDALANATEILRREAGHEETLAAVTAAEAVARAGTPDRSTLESLGGGWTGEEALAISLACALTADTSSSDGIKDALCRAVAHDGDSDSTGAITGNLLGAQLGMRAVPQEWLADLELANVIDRIARDLYQATVDVEKLPFDDYPST